MRMVSHARPAGMSRRAVFASTASDAKQQRALPSTLLLEVPPPAMWRHCVWSGR